ncbi:hypothetical protein VNO78_07640 [Psophocarpus tetragonolobus]|uniref:AMP-binding enzyme C-terminal domain-containing protein n=1 Tax=Psophocarpus tetragonolobus TaxID=3891 RepID=A0AAN9SWH4_PSOTE
MWDCSDLVSLLLKQSEAKLLFVDYEFLDIAQEALQILSKTTIKLPCLVLINSECGDPSPVTPNNNKSPSLIYEDLIAKVNLEFEVKRPMDELDPITISYTSGTTANLQKNISSIELEAVSFSHPAVFEAAVVGKPDDYWGETPYAFVKLKEGCSATAEEIIKFCQIRLSPFMAPRTVVFSDLPMTSTGKTQKHVLRDKAKAMKSLFKKNITPL